MSTISVYLASQSAYRRRQLEQIGIRATAIAPHLDERGGPDEPLDALAIRLAREKALAVEAKLDERALVIAGDQTAGVDGIALHKPGHMDAAMAQLMSCSGKTVVFYSAVCVSFRGSVHQHCTRTEVRFRALSQAQIRRYLAEERPFDCAGSFKCEGLGITLFEAISSEDPSALVGLPLIALTSILKDCGVYPLD